MTRGFMVWLGKFDSFTRCQLPTPPLPTPLSKAFKQHITFWLSALHSTFFLKNNNPAPRCFYPLNKPSCPQMGSSEKADPRGMQPQSISPRPTCQQNVWPKNPSYCAVLPTYATVSHDQAKHRMLSACQERGEATGPWSWGSDEERWPWITLWARICCPYKNQWNMSHRSVDSVILMTWINLFDPSPFRSRRTTIKFEKLGNEIMIKPTIKHHIYSKACFYWWCREKKILKARSWMKIELILDATFTGWINERKKVFFH